MKILNGRRMADGILKKVRGEVKRKGLKLRLAIVQIGEDQVSRIFIQQKEKACLTVGIGFKLFNFPASIGLAGLKRGVRRIVNNPVNSGIVIQLPLPTRINPEEILDLVPSRKDVDVLSESSLGKFYQGTSKILPPTVNGILRLLKSYKINLKGKNVVIVGAGRLVGFPLALQLLKEKATLSVLNEFSRDASSVLKKADILISGVGKPGLIKGNMLKRGVAAIDAGSSIKGNKMVGDLDLRSVSKKASYITPVPGGVGPLTVACLIENLVKLND